MTRDIILFDLDGTLTDPKEGITGCVRYALERFGIAVDDREILTPFIGPPLLDSFERFCGMNRLHAEQAIERYRERFSTVGLYENRVIPGISEMLAALCPGCCLLKAGGVCRKSARSLFVKPIFPCRDGQSA